VVPRGDTIMQAGDEVIALVVDESEGPVKSLLIGD
jgi:Trk K+ transport system NAD-binding subunit